MEDIAINSSIQDIIDLDPFDGAMVAETISLRAPLIGFGANTSLLPTHVNITINYTNTSRDINNESSITIYKCSTWSYTSRTCSSSWEALDIGNLSVVANEIWSNSTSFSAYMVTEASCGDGTCSSSYGETSSTCSSDCPASTPSPSAGGGGGSSSGGSASAETTSTTIEELESSIEKFKELIGGVKIETTSIIKELGAGETKTAIITLQNTLSSPATISIAISGELKELIAIESNIIILQPKEQKQIILTISSNPKIKAKTYSGKIILTSNGQSSELPATIIVKPQLEKEYPSQLPRLTLNPLQTRISPGETIKLQLSIYNLPELKEQNLTLLLQLIKKDTGKLITEKQESIITKGQFSVIKDIKLQENIPQGGYIIKAILTNDAGSLKIESQSEITIRGSFLNKIVLDIELWQYLAILSSISFLSITILYIKSKKKKSKIYKNLILLSQLPKESPLSINLGKIAGTIKPAFFDLNQLKNHLIIAGSTGSGKSIAAQDIAEEALIKNIPVIVFDSSYQWTGFIKKNHEWEMLMHYSEFNMDESLPRPFKTNIRLINNPREVININEYLHPGQLTLFCFDPSNPKAMDNLISSTLHQISKSFSPSKEIKLLIVYENVHKLLKDYNYKSSMHGIIHLGNACRDFGKLGIGLILTSEVLNKLVKEIHAHIATEIQMKTNSREDIKAISRKYGKDFAGMLTRVPAGIGLIQNQEYNNGNPYLIAFRPTLHNPHRLTNDELKQYLSLNEELDDLSYQTSKLKELKQPIISLEIELSQSRNNLYKGNLEIASNYIENLSERLKNHWKKLNKKPIHKKQELLPKSSLQSSITQAQKQRILKIKIENNIRIAVKTLLEKGCTIAQIREAFKEKHYPQETLTQILREFKKSPRDELKEYIKRALKEGITKEEVKKELIKSHWNESSINKILSEVES